MSENSSSAKPSIRRVVLTPAASETLLKWKEQLATTFPGLEISERNLIEWSLSQAPILSVKQLDELRRRFFDEVKHLGNIIEQLQLAKSEEERVAIRRILISAMEPKSKRALRRDSTALGVASKGGNPVEEVL